MKEVYQFTVDDVVRLLFADLKKNGKTLGGKPYGVKTTYHFSFGTFSGCTVELTDPIPGSRSLD